MRTRFAGKTDVGLLRERNEDSFLVFPRFRIGAVADGMGGHLSGDVASSLAISTMMEFFQLTVGPDRTWPFPYDNDLTEEENCVVVGVRLANQQVFNRARSSQNESGMGTTIVGVMFTRDAKEVIVGHVGDSRCYRIRDGHITQLTSDHSLVSEVTEIAPWLSEEEVNQLPSNVITRALGMAPDVVVDLLTTATRAGDTYLLCSDGLNGMLSDSEILEICVSNDDMDVVCGDLIDRANAAGGNDNTTIVMVRVEDAEDEDEEDGEASNRDAIAGGAVELLGTQSDLDQTQEGARAHFDEFEDLERDDEQEVQHIVDDEDTPDDDVEPIPNSEDETDVEGDTPPAGGVDDIDPDDEGDTEDGDTR